MAEFDRVPLEDLSIESGREDKLEKSKIERPKVGAVYKSVEFKPSAQDWKAKMVVREEGMPAFFRLAATNWQPSAGELYNVEVTHPIPGSTGKKNLGIWGCKQVSVETKE